MIGIYGINIPNCNKWYIGSSKELEIRIYTHRKQLESNNHCVAALQLDYNNYKELDIQILKTLDNHNELESWENYYIGLYDSIKNGYNSILARRTKNIIIRPTIIEKKEESKLLTPLEIIEIFSLNINELKEMIDFGMPYFKLSKNVKMFEKKEVIKWLEKNRDLVR